jgi:hypothetical protein
VKSSLATIIVAALAMFVAPDAARTQTGASSIFQVVHTPNENFKWIAGGIGVFAQ